MKRYLPILLILAAAALLRIAGLGRDGLWVDEAFTAMLVRGTPAELLAGLDQDDAPPLYYFLVRGLTLVIGHSEAALRLLSALAGVGAVAVLWLTARRHAPRLALPAATVFAFSTLAIFYARQARSYGLVHFLATVLLLATLELRVRPRRVAAILFAVSGLALIYTHNLTIVLLLPAAACVVPAVWRHARRLGIATASVMALAAVPWAMRLLHQLGPHNDMNFWMRRWWDAGHHLMLAPVYTWGVFANGAAPALRAPVPLPGFSEPFAWLRWVIWAASLLALAAFAVSLVRRTQSGRTQPGRSQPGRTQPGHAQPGPTQPARTDAGVVAEGDRGQRITWLILVLAPLALMMAISAFNEPVYVVGRTDTLILPVFTLLLAAGWAALRPRWLGRAAIGLWVVTGLLGALPLWTGSQQMAKRADEPLAMRLGEEIGPRDILAYGSLGRPTLEYYARSQGWWERPAWSGPFPSALNRHPAGIVPTTLDSAAVYYGEARQLRERWEREGVERAWILAVRDSEGSPAGVTRIDAQDIAFPQNLLLAALVGLRPIDIAWEYRQDWVSGDRVVLRVDRALWAPIDSLPGIEVRR